MNDRSFTGASLETALREKTLEHPTAVLTGMVKMSDKKGFIQFSQSECESWVDLPSDMIMHAEHAGRRRCRDHAHPLMKVALKEPKDPEARTLVMLLAQLASNDPIPSSAATVVPANDFGMELGGFASHGGAPYDLASEGMFQPPMTMGGSPFPASLGRFGGFGGFGRTLPSCRWVRVRQVCGSALPGYPPPVCEYLVNCCTWPNGATNCP